ncbi:nuclear transport factor 2 family protein [Chitinophaga vietnamensis]|uniref:nuclear transport factor 2 family protein n=1 Tax=Chitinophaga vietnamensis TaxID=2593957 RepID=UPI0013754789|nr:nuclear transport factor 2 family protein [Chitinophaga vietnamensis]
MDSKTITSIESKSAVAGAVPSPFATLISAVASEDMATVESLLADLVEWDMMPTSEIVHGKDKVMQWLKTGSADQKEPAVITDLAVGNWGVFEYWNIGTVSKELIAFGNEEKWPWPVDPNRLVGQKYKVAQCFLWRLDAAGKIDLIRQYLDTRSVWTQFK